MYKLLSIENVSSLPFHSPTKPTNTFGKYLGVWGFEASSFFTVFPGFFVSSQCSSLCKLYIKQKFQRMIIEILNFHLICFKCLNQNLQTSHSATFISSVQKFSVHLSHSFTVLAYECELIVKITKLLMDFNCKNQWFLPE